MAITVYHKKGRKNPVYLVCGRVGPDRVMDKSFPFTEEGLAQAKAYWAAIESQQSLYYWLKGRQWYEGDKGAIKGLRIYRRPTSEPGEYTRALRVDLVINGVRNVKSYTFNDKIGFEHAFNTCVQFLREIREVDIRDWVDLQKGLAKSYYYYLNQADLGG